MITAETVNEWVKEYLEFRLDEGISDEDANLALVLNSIKQTELLKEILSKKEETLQEVKFGMKSIELKVRCIILIVLRLGWLLLRLLLHHSSRDIHHGRKIGRFLFAYVFDIESLFRLLQMRWLIFRALPEVL